MARAQIRYYRPRGPGGNAYWEPGKFGALYGFSKSVPLGPDGSSARASAEVWNVKLDLARAKAKEAAPPVWPPGSLGSFYTKFKGTDAWALMSVRTHEDYERAWPILEMWAPKPEAQTLAHTLVSRITPDLSERLHADIHPAHNPDSTYSANEAHRTLKVWRALLQALVDYRVLTPPAAIGRVSNPAPAGRDGLWLHDEVVRLSGTAVFGGFAGLAVGLRIGWDAMLSPVDIRALPLSGWRPGADGAEIASRRGKTGKRIRHAIGPETAAIVETYLDWLKQRGVILTPESPIVRRPDGRAYMDKDSFGDDFRLVRAAAFPEDARQLLDIRRSAATEARLGGASRDDLGKAMANRIDESDALFDTYVLAASRRVLAARAEGRAKMAARFAG